MEPIEFHRNFKQWSGVIMWYSWNNYLDFFDEFGCTLSYIKSMKSIWKRVTCHWIWKSEKGTEWNGKCWSCSGGAGYPKSILLVIVLRDANDFPPHLPKEGASEMEFDWFKSWGNCGQCWKCGVVTTISGHLLRYALKTLWKHIASILFSTMSNM